MGEESSKKIETSWGWLLVIIIIAGIIAWIINSFPA